MPSSVPWLTEMRGMDKGASSQTVPSAVVELISLPGAARPLLLLGSTTSWQWGVHHHWQILPGKLSTFIACYHFSLERRLTCFQSLKNSSVSASLRIPLHPPSQLLVFSSLYSSFIWFGVGEQSRTSLQLVCPSSRLSKASWQVGRASAISPQGNFGLRNL